MPRLRRARRACDLWPSDALSRARRVAGVHLLRRGWRVGNL